MKPKKKIDKSSIDYEIDEDCCEFKRGYNQACKDWDKFLPNEKDIGIVLCNTYCVKPHTGKIVDIDICLSQAKAIHDRLNKEEA